MSSGGDKFLLARRGTWRGDPMGAADISGDEGVELGALLDLVLAVPSWTEVRDLAVRHPALLTDRTRQELERRAAAARDGGDEGLASEIELARDTLVAWSR